MDAAEFAKVGAELVDLGGRLNSLKAQRSILDQEIALLEGEVRPLITRHAQMIAEIVGSPAPVAPVYAAPAPVHQLTPGHLPQPAPAALDGPVDNVLKARVIKFLERCEPGVSAGDVADTLRVDVTLIRQVMHDLSLGR